MGESRGLETLFQYAREYRFNDFAELLQELEANRPTADYWEAYLMRAQIKLYATDATVGDDLEMIARFSGPPKFPLLGGLWPCDAPNRFIVFSKTPGALRGFLQNLPGVRRQLSRWYGERGDIAVRQVQGDIHYFLGEIQSALDLAEEQHRAGLKSNTDALLNQSLRFRCHLAMRAPRKAEECMLDMIRLSRANPECLAPYQALRGWANLTTNWNGDSPRFYDDPSGRRMPVLEDRLAGIRMGCAQTTPLEAPFVEYAERGDENAYAVRQYYMDLFHAMYWFQAGDRPQTERYFRKVYQVSLDTGFFMPLVECGEQITPLLRYVKDSGWGCSPEWLDEVADRAGEYEKSLTAYQSSDI